MVLDGTIALPAADVPEPFVDADDIADVAVAALTADGHHAQVYEVTGKSPPALRCPRPERPPSPPCRADTGTQARTPRRRGARAGAGAHTDELDAAPALRVRHRPEPVSALRRSNARAGVCCTGMYECRGRQDAGSDLTEPRVIAAILEHIDTHAARAPPIACA